jgi:hypothetical protein
VIRRVVFRPAAVRDLARLDRVVQARIDAALVRFASTGHGDVKSLKDRPGELGCGSASGGSFSIANGLISSASSVLTIGVKLTDPQVVRIRGCPHRIVRRRSGKKAKPPMALNPDFARETVRPQK